MIHKKVQDAALIAVPYVALLFTALLGIALPTVMESGANAVWLAVRWFVRIATVAGAFWAWRWQPQEPRPLWAYAWLGFATYEVVGLLLMTMTWLINLDRPSGLIVSVLVIPLLFLAFIPEAVVALWVAIRSRIRAAFTVFPHAAVTAPLFLLTGIVPLEADVRGLFVASLVPLLLATAAAVIFAYTPHRWRWYYLFGAVAICQTAFAVGSALSENAPLFLTLFFVGLGIAIQSVPSLLYAVNQVAWKSGGSLGWADRLPLALQPADEPSAAHVAPVSAGDAGEMSPNRSGGEEMTDEQNDVRHNDAAQGRSAREPVAPGPPGPSTLDRFYKAAVVVLTALIVLAVGLVIARATVYKVHEYERGLHLRGGRFLGVQQPGWHMQIPLVDTVLIVTTNERLGYVEQIPAMTSDKVTMIVSLQYTFKVTDPEQYALQVDDPERIVFEFVQGKLRDVVNTKAMDDIMNNRAVMNQEVMESLKEKEEQYGVEFITVQMQNASPPEEVLTAIKDRMVALQRQEQAQAEAAQRQTLADADLYAAQKEADAEAYQITTTAQADAERIRLTSGAEKEAVNALLAELEGKGDVGEKFIEYLIAQQLKENSKWVISGGDGTPILDLR